MIKFWVKTTKDGQPGISVLEHMLNVGFVAKSLAKINSTFLSQSELDLDHVGFFAALHDLGKISPGFQQKCCEWIKQNDLITISKNCCWDTSMELNHGKTSQATIQSILSEFGIQKKILRNLAAVLGAHHGRILALPDPRGITTGKINEDGNKIKSTIDWNQERINCVTDILKILPFDINSFSLNFLFKILHCLIENCFTRSSHHLSLS